MRIIKQLLLVFLLTVCTSCMNKTSDKKFRQLSRDVLSHYKAMNNPLKEKAARFLLNNLKDRYAIEGERYKIYSDTIKMYYQNADTLHKKLISLRNGSFSEFIVKDIDVLTPGYLIENIDLAFESLERSGWRSEVSFDNFCEYILPYRIGNEPVENWRREIVNDTAFQITGDTLVSFNNVKKAATWFIRKQSVIEKDFLDKWGDNSAGIPDLQFSVLSLLNTGDCSIKTQISIFACMAAAIPVSGDFTPHWANSRYGHSWAAVITGKGSVPFQIPIKDSLGFYRGNDFVPSKVYRSTFSKNKKSHAIERGYCSFLSGFFNNPRLIDVTDQYMPAHEISIPLLTKKKKSRFAYLAVADRDSWVPVGWGKIKSGKAKYSLIGENAVYLPVLIEDSGSKPVNFPFKLNGDGHVIYLKPDHDNKINIKLTRKYPLRSFITIYINRMLSGRFQASDDKDFKNTVTLYTITESPGVYYNEIQVHNPDKYRFLRYLGKDSSQCNVAELEFYEKDGTQPLKGDFIGTEGSHPFKNAFDGNPLTFFNTYKITDPWIGLDLGEPKEISKIRFVSRNDKNHIIPGNSYELFYWENEWKSLGQKTATDKILTYENVPSDCLFLLRNDTEGKEERIFTYENDNQVFW